MGHESQIEPWSPFDRRSALLVSETDRLRCERAMKTAGRENPNRWAKHVQQPSTWCGRSNQILLIQGGCEARKIAAVGEVFFLTSTFIERIRRSVRSLMP